MKNRILLWGFSLLGSLSLMACGASKSSVSSSSLSNVLPPIGGTGPSLTTESGLLAQCNMFNDANSQLAGYLSTYYSNGQLVPDIIRLSIAQAPAALSSDTSGNYIQIYRWGEDSPGAKNFNSQPVQMYFMLRGTGTLLNQTPLTSISASAMAQMISSNKLDSSITPANFLSHVIILLEGMDINYDAISMVVYGSDNQPVSQTDTLIPAFSADPNLYIQNHPAPDLQALHPFYSLRNSGRTQQQFSDLATSYCQSMM